MKNLFTKPIATLLAFALPVVVSAQAQNFDPGGGAVGTFLANVISFINGILIPFLLGIGFLIFVWGIFRYFIAGGADEEARDKGKSLIVYSVLGFVLILIFWGIVNIVANATGIAGEELETGNIPDAIPPGLIPAGGVPTSGGFPANP
jgi:hypothetical protein